MPKKLKKIFNLRTHYNAGPTRRKVASAPRISRNKRKR
jgi:hypothetical protein